MKSSIGFSLFSKLVKHVLKPFGYILSSLILKGTGINPSSVSKYYVSTILLFNSPDVNYFTSYYDVYFLEIFTFKYHVI